MAQRSVSAPTKRECREKREALEARFAGLAPEASQDPTVNEWLDEWLDWCRVSSSIELTTLNHYGETAKRYIRPVLGEMKLLDLTPAVTQRWLGSMTASNQMRRKALAVVRASMSRAVRLGLVHSNPASAERLEVPAHTPRQQPHLEREEAGRLLNILLAVGLGNRVRHIGNEFVEVLDEETFRRLTDLQHRGEALVPLLGLTTGMRNGELRALTWENVDIEKGRLLVCRSVKEIPDLSQKRRIHTVMAR